jgi:phage-related protein
MDLFKLLGTIAIDNTKANEALDDTSKKAQGAGDETESAFGKIGAAAGRIATGIGVAATAIGGAWLAAIESTREYRTQMGMLDAAYQSAGHSSDAAKQTFSDLNAVLGDSGQATEAAQHLAKLTDNEKELQTWTNICTGVYATFGESLPIEGLTEAANETAKTGVLTGGLTDALNWAGIQETEFQKKLDACSNEQERQKLIMDTLNKTYSEASEQYQKTNKDVMDANRAQEKLTAAFAELGRVGEPILTLIKEKVADMVAAAVPHLENFVQKVKDVATWIKENQDTVHAWVAVILGAGVSIGTFLLILNWGKIMTAAANAVKVVRTAILAMNAAMLANPIGLVVALIAGLVVAFVYLWNNVEGFRNFWKKAWETIKSAASTAKNAITKAFSNIGSWFKEKFQQIQKAGQDAMAKVKKWFSDTYKSITSTFSNIGGWFRSKFQSAWSGIKSVFSSWGSFFGGLWTKIKSKFSSIGSSLGKSMGDAVKSGMNKVISSIQNTINKGIGLINSAIKLANKLPGINVGTVPKLSLPRLAQGGVLEKGQVGLLEGSGAEAVVPLENNRGWLTKVAGELAEIQQENHPAQMDGRYYAAMERIIALLQELRKMKIYLDSGTMVGELVPAIDGALSIRWGHAMRENTR